MSNISFLIDTNIFIPLEPTEAGYVNMELASTFHRLIQDSGNHIFIHPLIDAEFKNDKDEKRRAIRQSLKSKYPILENPPSEEILPDNIRDKGKEGSHSWFDNHYLAAVYSDCTHYLVTEDRGIHKNALKLGIQDKVLFLDTAVELLVNLEGKAPLLSHQVDLVHPREIDIEQEFFNSLREDYDDFTKWFNTKVKPDPSRNAFLIRPHNSNELAAIAIVKEEDGVEYGPKGKTVKICTFKVMPQFGQQRIGELLLKSVLQYCSNKGMEYTYLTTFEKQGALISFLDNFGFMEAGSRNERDEQIFYKKLIPSAEEKEELSSWDFNVKFGPFAYNFKNNSSFVIPIKPNYHNTLFPELSTQMTLFSDKACGNSIRKSYICHGNTKRVEAGDMLFFYQSEFSDIRVVAIAENVLRTSKADEVMAFVGNRTVYTEDDIKKWCLKETLVINFRVVLLSEQPVDGRQYFSSAPMSVNSFPNERALEIIHTLENN